MPNFPSNICIYANYLWQVKMVSYIHIQYNTKFVLYYNLTFITFSSFLCENRSQKPVVLGKFAIKQLNMNWAIEYELSNSYSYSKAIEQFIFKWFGLIAKASPNFDNPNNWDHHGLIFKICLDIFSANAIAPKTWIRF